LRSQFCAYTTTATTWRPFLELTTVSLTLVAVVFVAISLGALIKGITGLGLPLVAVPAIASFTSVEEAVVLMIIPTFASNLWIVHAHRRFSPLLSEHFPFLVAGFVGGILGTFLLVAVDDRWLKLVLAAWLALYLVQYAFGDFLRAAFRVRGPAAGIVGAVAGTIQGATGVSAHIVAPFFHGRDLRPEAYALLIASAFLTFSSAQLLAATGTSLFTTERVAIALLALVPTLLFTSIGIRLVGKISGPSFQRLLLGLFLVMEVKLLADVIGN